MQVPRPTPPALNQRPWVLRKPAGLLMWLQLENQPRVLLKARAHLCLHSSIFPSGPWYGDPQLVSDGTGTESPSCFQHLPFVGGHTAQRRSHM